MNTKQILTLAAAPLLLAACLGGGRSSSPIATDVPNMTQQDAGEVQFAALHTLLTRDRRDQRAQYCIEPLIVPQGGVRVLTNALQRGNTLRITPRSECLIYNRNPELGRSTTVRTGSVDPFQITVEEITYPRLDRAEVFIRSQRGVIQSRIVCPMTRMSTGWSGSCRVRQTTRI